MIIYLLISILACLIFNYLLNKTSSVPKYEVLRLSMLGFSWPLIPIILLCLLVLFVNATIIVTVEGIISFVKGGY